MPKSAADFEGEFLKGLKAQSGRDLKAWMALCKKSGETKQNALLKHLKTNYEFNHMQANFLAAIYLNGGKPVYGDGADLMGTHFEGNKEAWKPVYEALAKKVQGQFKGVEIVPTKGYISFRNPREFAVAKITAKAMRVGMDLGDRAFEGPVEKAKSLGTMPRISHMVEVMDAKGISAALGKLLKEANARVNP